MPIFDSFISGVNAGQQQADRNNRRRVGSLMSGGDYAGASRAAYEGGDLQTGQAVAAIGQTEASNARIAQMMPFIRQGDWDGAMQVATTPQEFAQINQMRSQSSEEERALAASKFEALAGVAAGLGRLPPQDRLAEAQRLAPIFGMDPGQITAEMLTDESLRAIAIRSMGAKEFMSLQRPQVTASGMAISGIDPVTGQPIPLNVAGQPSAPTAAPASPASPAPAGQQSGAPRGLRNNNPLNIEDGAFTRSQPGYAGREGQGRFATFQTPEQGAAAADRLLGSYIQRGYNTPAEIIGRWAPSSENGASTSNYVNYVAGRLGIGPNDPVTPDKIPALRQAMAEFENGRQQGQAPARQASAAPGYTVTPLPPSPADQRAEAANRRADEAAARDQARFDRETARGQPLPVGVQKLEDADIEAIQAAGTINSQLASQLQRLTSGQLNLGPAENLVSQGRNAVGMGDRNSRNFAEFRATLERMRNDSLRLNKGVQTEGDAQRAWNELLTNLNDEGLVAQRLQTIMSLNERAIQLRTAAINQRRANYGAQPLDTGIFVNPGQGTPQRQTAPAAPRVGEVRRGYRYRGGNPASQSSWEKVN